MIKVLIIDDEPNVRMGLRKMIDWESNGFKVCDEAEDAEQGYKKIMNIKPDIVLMDIKMPGKLGIDLIREARNANFEGKFIILSGYSNFEYAKEAIKYGVKSYILKPIDEDELMDSLLKLKEEIREEDKLKDNVDIVRKVNLKKLITGDVKDSFAEYNCDGNFTLVLISIEDEKRDEFVEKYISDIKDIDIVNVNQYIVILFRDINYGRILKILLGMKEKVNGEIEFLAVVSEELEDISMISEQYKKALKIMKNKFLYLEKSVVTIGEFENNEADITLDMDNFIKRVQSYVEVQDYEKLEESIKSLEKCVIANKYPEDKIKAKFIDILLNIREKLFKDYDIDKSEILNNENIINKIYSKKSLSSMSQYLMKELNDMSKKISLGSSDNNIKRIISYMEKNYYKDLKLEGLAKIFNYNSAYLGKLLKNSTGENFNTRLDKIRIEKAKSLLVNDKLKVYQVCEKVGYKNIDYFHSKFKKYVGTTPLSYKKENEKIEK